MSERPVGEGGERDERADPDATIVDSGRSRRANAPARSGEPDPDATVAIPAGGRPVTAPPAQAFDPDATVAVGAPARALTPSPVAALDPDATVAIPTPGRRRETLPPAPSPQAEAAPADLAALGGLNPLIEAANPVLGAVPQIRHALRHPDPQGLRASLRARIEAFVDAARKGGIAEQSALAARYALCSLLDDSASATPWGSEWARHGLLSEIEGEGWGGEKFFTLLERFAEEPVANQALVEFFYVCLALGYEGRYRGVEGGRDELAHLRDRLHGLIRAVRLEDSTELSVRWRGVATQRPRHSTALSLWAAGAGAALLLAVAYLGYSFSLGSASDPVARDIARLTVNLRIEPSVAAPPASVPAAPRVSQQLAAEIGRGEVAVAEDARQSTIVIRSDRLFASGSARVEEALHPIILRIGEALEGVPGAVLVTGHTDDVPIRTARFPSNWELSTERANSVVRLLRPKLGDPARLRGEGLADSEPAAPNDSAANRARNRRVVIILRAAP